MCPFRTTISNEGVQVSSSGSYSGSVYLVEAANVRGKTYCNAAYLGPPPAAPSSVTFYAYGRIRRVSADASTSSVAALRISIAQMVLAGGVGSHCTFAPTPPA